MRRCSFLQPGEIKRGATDPLLGGQRSRLGQTPGLKGSEDETINLGGDRFGGDGQLWFCQRLKWPVFFILCTLPNPIADQPNLFRCESFPRAWRRHPLFWISRGNSDDELAPIWLDNLNLVPFGFRFQVESQFPFSVLNVGPMAF